MSRLAFDIETVSPDVPHDEYPDFDDSNDFEFLISAVGHQETPGGEVETELFFRDGWGPGAELDVIEATLDWLEARDGDTLFTYNGDRFDLVHFVGRAEIASEELGTREGLLARVQDFLDGIEHDDIRHDARTAYGGYPSLEGVCKKNGVEVRETKLADYGLSQDRLDEHRDSKTWGTECIVNSDLPVLGDEYLDLVEAEKTDSDTFESLRGALDHYARADIRPLFEIADCRPFATPSKVR